MITKPEQVPPLTTNPEQETLENICEIPQENLTVEPHSEPENTQLQATNQPQIVGQSPIDIEIIENDTPPSSPMPFGPAYKPLTLDEITIPSDQMLSIMENIIM
jgi:hypothetical protein